MTGLLAFAEALGIFGVGVGLLVVWACAHDRRAQVARQRAARRPVPSNVRVVDRRDGAA